MGLNIFLAVVAGFTAGCTVTTIIALHIYTKQQKILEERAENRRIVVNTIGKLSATIENAFSAYRIGTMNFDSLRQVLLSKIDEINTTLRSNIEYLDSFYVKNMERFIEDQKAFILRNQGDLPAVDAPKVRSVSRAAVVEKKEPVRRQPPAAFEPPREEEAQESVFEARQPEEKPVNMDKTVEISKTPSPEEAVEPEQKDYASEALSAFELGATTRIPLDAIKQYQKPEEETKPQEPSIPEFGAETPAQQDSVFNLEDVHIGDPASIASPSAIEDDLPEKGKPVFESALDVEATQEFSVDELMKKAPSRFAPEPKPQDQKTGSTQDVMDINLSKGPSPQGKHAGPRKKGSEDDSLITGEDVMDQMDNFFGFSE